VSSDLITDTKRYEQRDVINAMWLTAHRLDGPRRREAAFKHQRRSYHDHTAYLVPGESPASQQGLGDQRNAVACERHGTY
jgi:hypothetical protein